MVTTSDSEGESSRSGGSGRVVARRKGTGKVAAGGGGAEAHRRSNVPTELGRLVDHMKTHGAALVRELDRHRKSHEAVLEDQTLAQHANVTQEMHQDANSRQGALGNSSPPVKSNAKMTTVVAEPQQEQKSAEIQGLEQGMEKLEKENTLLRKDMQSVTQKLDMILDRFTQKQMAPPPAAAAAAVAPLKQKPEEQPQQTNNSNNRKLEQQINQQHKMIKDLLEKLSETQQQVERLTKEREMELLMVDEDSLGDIGTKTLTTSFRRLAALQEDNQTDSLVISDVEDDDGDDVEEGEHLEPATPINEDDL